MKTLTIDLDNWLKYHDKLSLEGYCIAQLIYEKTITKDILVHYDIPSLLKDLEENEFIKVIDVDSLDIEPRERLIKLFEKSEKNTEALEVLNYFNTKYKEKFAKSRGFKSPSLLKNINARLKEGYTKQDLMSVIDFKFKEWWGTSMQEHLYPDTLFNSVKFPKYINQVALKGNNSWSNLV